MYIQKVVIKGFKAYREETSTGLFSPKVDVVVGANGSGKSNFFHAIRSVLSGMFQNLHSEDTVKTGELFFMKVLDTQLYLLLSRQCLIIQTTIFQLIKKRYACDVQLLQRRMNTTWMENMSVKLKP